MTYLDITLLAVCLLFFFAFVIHQEILFGRMIRQNEKVMKTSSERLHHLTEQNNTLLEHADHRLDKANEMVLTLAHSADQLSVSISHLKEMMVHLEQVYTSRNDMLVKNRDEYRSAYNALLSEYKEKDAKLEALRNDAMGTLQELAHRPTNSINNS